MKNIIKMFLIPLLLSSFITIISFGGQRAEWKGKIEVKNGVKVIKNPKTPMYGSDIFSAEEDLTIGIIEGDENYMFSEIRNFVVDENENIYVADSKETHIKVFDKNGKFLRLFGKVGQGPGEIGRLYSIQLTAKNEILVNDSGNRRIIYLTLEGKFIRFKDTGKFQLARLYCDSNENYYFMNLVMELPDFRFELVKIDSEMNPIATIAKTPLPGPSEPYKPFRPTFYFQVLDDDCLLYGYPERYELQIFNPEGKVIKKVTREYNPVPISKEEKEEVRKRFSSRRKIEFPPHHPAFYYFKVDEEGRIFVQTWEKPDSGEEYSFDVFDSEGRYLAKIPLNFRPAVMKKGKIYTIEEDEDGYQFIKRYIVTWRY